MYRISKIETGKRIRKVMAEYGVTVREIQEEMELESPQAVYKWLNGKALPSTENLLTLGRLLHVPMEELIVMEQGEDEREMSEEWEKNHPPIFMAYRFWTTDPVRRADAKRLSILVEDLRQERLRTVKSAS